MKVRRLSSLILVGILISLFAGCNSSGHIGNLDPQQSKATTQEVLRTLDGYFEAVNSRDPVRFLTYFINTDDLTVIEDKDQRLSRKAFSDFLDEFFRSVSEINAVWENRSVFPISPGVAVVTGTFKVSAKDTKASPMAFRSAFTFVLVKRGDRWLVKHVHESSLDL